MQLKATSIHRTTCLIAFLALVIVFQPLSLSQTPFWQQTNGPYYLPFNIIVGGGQQPLYAVASSTVGGGIYMSTDKGNSWRKIDSSIVTYHVRSMSLNSNGYIFIATDAYAYRSTDEGEHWTTLYLNSWCNSIAVHTNDELFAGAGGVFRSTDNGDNWIPAGISLSEVYSVYSAGGSSLLAVAGSGLQRTTDNGATWTQTAITNPAAYSFAKDGTGVLFVAMRDSGIYRSTDSGATWTQVNVGLKSLDVRSIAVTPGGLLIAGIFGGGMYSSVNEGEEWTENIADIDSPFFNVVHVETDSVFFAGTTSGIYSSPDAGNHWHRVTVGTASSLAEVYALNISPTGTSLAGAYGGVYSSTNKGLGWTQLGTTYVLAIARAKNGDLFAGTGSYGVLHSSNDGRTWLQTGLIDSTIRSIVIDAEGRIYAGGTSLMQSTDNGATWSALGIRNETIYGMAVTKNDAILVATDYDGLYRSTDHGATWTLVSVVWEVSHAVGMNANGDIYAEVEDYFGGKRSVYRSTDEGTTWTVCGVLNGSVQCFAFNASGNIFAGTDSSGIFRSMDNGSSWSTFNSGLTSERVFALAVDDGSFLYAGTAKGVFITSAPTTNIATYNAGTLCTFLLSQNYPNPFNPSTAIRYSLASLSKVKLIIYNVLGQVVSTMVDEEQSAGYHNVRWTAKVSSGIYIYRIEAAAINDPAKRFVDTKKMLLLR